MLLLRSLPGLHFLLVFLLQLLQGLSLLLMSLLRLLPGLSLLLMSLFGLPPGLFCVLDPCFPTFFLAFPFDLLLGYWIFGSLSSSFSPCILAIVTRCMAKSFSCRSTYFLSLPPTA